MRNFPVMDIFAKNLQICLQRNGWTKQHLADLTGIHRPDISKIVSGKKRDIKISTAEAIAKALHVPLSDLLSASFKVSQHAA